MDGFSFSVSGDEGNDELACVKSDESNKFSLSVLCRPVLAACHIFFLCLLV